MIDYSHFVLLAGAAACACAGSAQPTPARDASSELAGNADADPEASGAARNPYAPTRQGPLDTYAWRNPDHAICSRSPERRESQTSQIKLSFRGSFAASPAPADVPDTWGAGPELETAGSPRHDPDFVVASLRPRLRSCFSSWLDRRAEAEGSVRFALELGCSGDVQSISAKAAGVDEPTVQCLFAVMAPATFDAPAGGHATIQVPVVFKNAGR